MNRTSAPGARTARASTIEAKTIAVVSVETQPELRHERQLRRAVLLTLELETLNDHGDAESETRTEAPDVGRDAR